MKIVMRSYGGFWNFVPAECWGMVDMGPNFTNRLLLMLERLGL